MPKLKLTPEFEDLLHLFSRMKDASVKTVVEELEKERRTAIELSREYLAARDAYHSGWRRQVRETGELTFRLIADGFVFVVIWAILWLAHLIQAWMPIEGRAANTLSTAHEYATVVLYVVLVAAVIKDMAMAKFIGKHDD